MIRVGISCEFLATKRNGTATYSANLLRGLGAQDGQRYVAYIAAPEARALIPPGAIEPRLVRPYNAYVRLAATLPLELLRRPVDLLHAQGWGPMWAPCPMLLTVHDIGWERFPQIYPKALALRLSYLVRDSARRAVRIVASSRYTAADLTELYQVPPEKIRVVYPPMNPDLAPVADPAARAAVLARHGIAGPYLLYVGSIEPKKNVHRLIEAYAALRRDYGLPHRLVIVGRPLWLAEPILRLPTDLGLGDHVRFTGPVPEDDLAALYSGADAFAFLGMYEGFGYPPLEALACGVPVLAASRTSLPEVLGDAALLVDPDDLGAVVRGLAELLAGGPQVEQRRERGRTRVRQFGVAAHARQIAAVYEESVAAAARRGSAERGRP
jgi:glycosyltransferase involved in cell wall biosynthesis